MTGQACTACGATAPENVSWCARCEHDTRDRLTRQETYRRELLTVLARMTRTEAINDGGRGGDPNLSWSQLGPLYLEESLDANGNPVPTVWEALKANPVALPYAKRAASVLRGQRALLLEWVRTLIPDYPSEAPVIWMASILLDHLPTIRKSETAGDYAHRLHTLEIRIIQTIDLPQERTRIKVGPCPNTWPDQHGHNQPCPGEIEAIIPADQHAPAALRCQACKQEWDTTQWTRTGRLIQARKQQLERQKTLAQQFIGKAAS